MFRKFAILALLATALVACRDEPTTTPQNNGTQGTNNTIGANNTAGTNNTVAGGLQVLPSSNPRVRFKGGERWANQLGRALELERAELCREFGRYDCAGEVHFIALGGVEPYRLRIDEPLPSPPITAPIAVERIALSACAERVSRDAAAPADAVLFAELSESASVDDLQAIGNRLYRRMLSRDAEPQELAELVTFWEELRADGGPNPHVDWATLSCFALASSTEMLFY